jgi:sulfur-oxidizing protein SoxY
MQRRQFVVALAGLAASLLALPSKAWAALWNNAAFSTSHLAEAETALQIHDIQVSPQISIIAPDQAENGAVVQIEISSQIAGTESISLLVEKNPTPLIAHYRFSNGAMPFVVTRIKMAETSQVKAVVKVGAQYFSASRQVVVLENGCG